MSDSSTEPMGLRERNKERRRSTILTCAFELFAERGYNATTIADIAAAADIAPRTVSLYFPTKQDIVLDAMTSLLQALSDALDNLQPGESAVKVSMETIRVRMKQMQRPKLKNLTAKIKADPEIHAIISAGVEAVEQRQIQAIARELGCEPNDPRVEITRGAGRSIMETAMFASSEADLDVIIDYGTEFMLAGIERIRQPAPAETSRS